MQTEDHPVEHLDFEDVIPEGNYGAGPMIVWDRGRWVQREDDQTGDNELLFDLYGYKRPRTLDPGSHQAWPQGVVADQEG